MLFLLSNHHRWRLRTHWVTRVVECLSAPALWRGALWLSTGFAVLVLAPAVSSTLSAPPPAAQQAPPQTPPGSQTTPAEQAPATVPPAITGGAGVGFRLENADLLQFINLVAGELKLNYVVDPAVKGAVTISTSGELKPADLPAILETVLKMNGATAIQTGNIYRVVPLAAAPKNPLAVSTVTSGAELPADDRMVMQIIPLKFVFAADMAKMLTPFLSEGGTVAVHDAGNTLILVDDSLNVKRLMEILQQFDNANFAVQRVRLLPVRNNVASALVPELEAIFSTYALSEKQTPLRFLPLDRINGILVAAADPAAFAEVEQWMGKLDLPAAPNGIQTFVYRVQYSEADRLVRLLNALRGVSGGALGEGVPSTPGRGRGAARAAAGTASLQEEVSQQGLGETAAGLSPFGAAGGLGAGTGPEPRLRIIPDPVSNSIVVQGTAQEYADIAKTLDKLDVVPRQVMIEARVYEVDLTGALSYGLEYALQQRAAGASVPPVLGDYGVTTSGTLTASGGIWFDGTRQLMAFLTATENRSRVKTLSAPTVLTTDSTEARIQVGQSVPVLTSQGLALGGQIAGNSLFTSTVNNVDTGIILSVIPRITSTGLVSLHINQEISNEVPPAATGIQSPSFTKRSVTTQAVAQDGQTIALGGLISYSYTKTTNRIPLLGDIPWLGALFGSTSYNTTETELIVLLTPRIISTLPGAAAATRELEDKLKDLHRDFKKDQLLKP
jgi:general secretion pathway protein D